MHRYLAVVIVAAAVLPAVSANAATVTETFVGTVQGANTKDSNGLFGPVGADVAGRTITIRTRYVTALLPTMHRCRINPNTCGYDSSANPSSGAVATSFAINNVTVSYTSTIYGDVFFDNGYQNRFVAETNVLSGQSQGGRGSAVNVSFSSPVKFGKQLSPANTPVANRSDLASFFKPGDTYASESLTFVVTKAAR